MADVTISGLSPLIPGNGYIPVSIGNVTGKAEIYVPHYPYIITSTGRIQNYSINGNNVNILPGTSVAITGIKYELPATTISVTANNSIFWQPGIGYTSSAAEEEPGFSKIQLFFNDSLFNRIVPLCNKPTLNAWKNFFIECVYSNQGFEIGTGYGYYGTLNNYPSADALYDGFHGRTNISPSSQKSNVFNLLDPNLGTDYQFFNDPTNINYQEMRTRIWLYWGRSPRNVNHSGNNGYWASNNLNFVSSRLFIQSYYNSTFRYIESRDVFELNPNVTVTGCPDIHSVLGASA